ncbi:hypothetical protein E2C01_070008 [Portunus trituberculatus]|uniref:Uncharacterized protein n=1 Tax=Portunus trituberculatus TaxID=210409 RepID=A0A5B7I2F1_PORTR|nr:hypothetical protein [Portunus trituberculatus]
MPAAFLGYARYAVIAAASALQRHTKPGNKALCGPSITHRPAIRNLISKSSI